jgi:hypothetical protein
MRDIEIVEQAIKKAQASGWDEFRSQYARVFRQHGQIMVEFLVGLEEPPLVVSLERVLFSASFAEHFWGMDTWYFVVFNDQAPSMDGSIIGWKSEKELEDAPNIPWEYYDNIPAYEYHLQQLALQITQEGRVAYIEKTL